MGQGEAVVRFDRPSKGGVDARIGGEKPGDAVDIGVLCSL